LSKSSAVVKREQDPKAAYANIEGLVWQRQEAIVKTLPSTIEPEQFINVALQAVTRTPKLLACSPASIVKALRDAAEVGLVPSGLMGSAYLVPYWNSGAGTYEAQFQAGYRGLIDLARRSGEVRLIEAHVVRERDDFAFAYGTEGFIRHVPYINLTNEKDGEGVLLDGGDYVAAYARAVLTSGEEQFEVMSRAEVEAIRKRSKAADSGPWMTDYAEMMRKTPTRKLLKYLPLSASALTRALEIEDAAESHASRVPQKAQTVSSQARHQLAASLGVSDEPQATESDASVEDDAEAIPLPVEAQGTFCGVVTDTGTCIKSPGHEGDHTAPEAAPFA